MERHLPYGITKCYLPQDAGEHTLPYPQPNKPVLPTPEGWKAELTLVLIIYQDGLPVTHPSGNHLNQEPRDHKSNVLTITLPRHHATADVASDWPIFQ